LAPPLNTLRSGTQIASGKPPPQLLQQQPPPQSQVRPETPLAPAQPGLLRVAVQESRRLRTSENVVLVVSEQNEICDVVRHGDREITLIGRQQGTARVEVWYDRQGTKRASYLVAVDAPERDDVQLEESRRKVERLLKYLYPGSQVTLVRQRDRLLARGWAVNQQQAAKIISTVKRSQLPPVVDEIAVRGVGR
jgi:Flp pilus assembly secretin CpaC